MIYLDTSVLLAHLLSEDHSPPDSLWQETLVSSRLIEYEAWTRVHNAELGRTHGEALGALLGRLAMIELVPPVLQRTLEPFPSSVRTLDALHLASIYFLQKQRQRVQLASYDKRLLGIAEKMEIPLFQLD